jgi:hypothetical protein
MHQETASVIIDSKIRLLEEVSPIVYCMSFYARLIGKWLVAFEYIG